mmetsp:Transcript_2331/g.6592  ORF Transcript_2331/g.6592 Transcript_2331/m.6592 type:complete len:473 (+) Transcript_2331:196-1614(+)
MHSPPSDCTPKRSHAQVSVPLGHKSFLRRSPTELHNPYWPLTVHKDGHIHGIHWLLLLRLDALPDGSPPCASRSEIAELVHDCLHIWEAKAEHVGLPLQLQGDDGGNQPLAANHGEARAVDGEGLGGFGRHPVVFLAQLNHERMIVRDELTRHAREGRRRWRWVVSHGGRRRRWHTKVTPEWRRRGHIVEDARRGGRGCSEDGRDGWGRRVGCGASVVDGLHIVHLCKVLTHLTLARELETTQRAGHEGGRVAALLGLELLDAAQGLGKLLVIEPLGSVVDRGSAARLPLAPLALLLLAPLAQLLLPLLRLSCSLLLSLLLTGLRGSRRLARGQGILTLLLALRGDALGGGLGCCKGRSGRREGSGVGGGPSLRRGRWRGCPQITAAIGTRGRHIPSTCGHHTSHFIARGGWFRGMRGRWLRGARDGGWRWRRGILKGGAPIVPGQQRCLVRKGNARLSIVLGHQLPRLLVN